MNITKAQVISSIQQDIASKTQEGSITPIVLAQIIENSVNLINTDVTQKFNVENSIIVSQVKKIEIPEGILGVADAPLYGFGVFEYEDINEISLPNSLTSLGKQAFKDNLITSVDFPPNLTNIGDEAFATNKIVNLVIPDNITSLGISAFNRNQLSSVTIGTGITRIEERAFFDNYDLNTIIIPDNVTYIGPSAFIATSITSVELPTVCTVESDSFPNETVITRR